MLKVNQKIKAINFSTKEKLEGKIISIGKIDFEKIIRIKGIEFEMSISESILNNNYKF